jgi:hypothetical protein
MTEQELERLIRDSGVGGRTAKKLRDAAKRQTGPTVSAGHGAPSADTTPVVTL